MADNRGTPLPGDRGAFDTVNHPDLHAKDIDDGALTRHLPHPQEAGRYARDDGTNWQSQLGILLADLLSYARGAIIRGGEAAWEALALGVAGTVLKSDGTDAAWDNVDHSELTGVGPDDHHARYTDAEAEAVADTQIATHAAIADAHHDPVTLDADADTLLSLATQALGLDTQAANTALRGPASGAAAAPTFREAVNADLPDPLAFKTAPSTLTIATGAVTATQNVHIIAAESGTEDDLDTINGLTDRQLLLIKADAGDTITVKHATGNIHFDSGADFTLSGDSWLLLFYDGTHAVALGAGGGGGASAFTDLTDTPASYSSQGGKLVGVKAAEDGLEFVEASSGSVGGAASDPVFHVAGALSTGTDQDGVWIAPRAATIVAVYMYCRAPGSAGSTIVDVNKNGTTIFTTQANRPELAYDDADQVAKSGEPDVTSLAENDVLSIDIDQVATGAEDLTVIVALAVGAPTRQTIFSFSGDLEVGDNPLRIYNQLGAAQTISKVFICVGTAPTGSAVIVDVHKDGTTIFTEQAHRPTIAAGANVGNTTDVDVATWGAGEYLTAHIDQVGSSTPGADLVVHIIHS